MSDRMSLRGSDRCLRIATFPKHHRTRDCGTQGSQRFVDGRQGRGDRVRIPGELLKEIPNDTDHTGFLHHPRLTRMRTGSKPTDMDVVTVKSLET